MTVHTMTGNGVRVAVKVSGEMIYYNFVKSLESAKDVSKKLNPIVIDAESTVTTPT